MSPPRLIVVTGATGFVGSHVVAALLERGLHVRATVRDPSDAAKCKHLRELPGAADHLELAAGDLERPGSFDAALRGADALVHTASAVTLSAKDPQREIVDVAVNGAREVVSAALATASVERIVMTSSIAAICGPLRKSEHLFTELDWNDAATVSSDAYATSKVHAERAARDLVARARRRVRFSAIHPSLVLGPVLSEQHLWTSPAFVFELMKGTWPGVPDFHFQVVDVRDVAQAHVRALELDAPSERYITSSAAMRLRVMAKLMREILPPDTRVPRWPLPDAAMYVAAVFDPRVTFRFLKNNLGRAPRLDTTRARSELGLAFRPVDTTVIDTVRSIEQGGYLKG